MALNDTRLLYVSDLYINQIQYALSLIYDESIIECIQLYDFTKSQDEYNLQFINILTDTLSYMTLNKASMEITFTDEIGYERII